MQQQHNTPMSKLFQLNWITKLLSTVIIVSHVHCSTGSGENNSAKDDNSTLTAFNYTPTKPENGKLKGVVELGASGFNSFVINVDKDKNWELVNAEWGTSSVVEGLASGEDLSLGLESYVSSMLDKYNVKQEDIHVVVSSGAQNEAGTSQIIEAFQELGYTVNKVTVEKEGEYALRSALPQQHYDDSFVMDLGSGNTKVSWIENGFVQAYQSPGSKYYKKGVSDTDAYSSTSEKAKQIPQSRRGQCFIIGGVAFKLASRDRNEKERFTVLRLPSKYKADGEKEKSGLNILKAIVESTGCKTFIFDWNANFAIGLLLDQDF